MDVLIVVRGAERGRNMWTGHVGMKILLLQRSLAMLDPQSSLQGEVRSLLQRHRRSPQLLLDRNWTWPCLMPQVVKGGTGLENVGGGLGAGATRKLVCMGESRAVEV